MRPILLLSACGLALCALSACGPSTPATQRVALDCPADQGTLKLKGQSPDKKTCDYVSEDGDQVQLRLLPVATSYEATLQPIEQELQGEQASAGAAAAQAGAEKAEAQSAGAQSAEARSAEARSAGARGSDASATAKAAGEGASAAARAAQEAANDALHEAQRDRDADRDSDDNDRGDRSHGDRVSIGSSGVHVSENDGKGDHADINLPGLHISADDDTANVNVGAVHVDAGEDGATVRVNREVRLRGEAFSRERHGFRATYILAKDNLKDGWRAVGYEAAGPKAGPVTVAVFKARDSHRGRVSDDIKRLVRRNGGI